MKRIHGTAIMATALILAISEAGGQVAKTGQFVRVGDNMITGFDSYRVTLASAGRHFVVVHRTGALLKLTSQQKGLTATCAKAEGDIDQANILQALTLTGGVHTEVIRPSSLKTSSETQTATADGDLAVYEEGDSTVHLTGNVAIRDLDPGADRTLHATGGTADLVLSPQSSNEQAFKSAKIDGHVKIDIDGTRIDTSKPKEPKKVPFSVHATCDHAKFDTDSHTIVLDGNVYVTSNDPLVGESAVAREVIHLDASGAVESVEAQSQPKSPGTTTIDLGGGG